MKLACNGSHDLFDLLREGMVDVDYIKLGGFGGFDEMFSIACPLRPVLLHGLGYNECTGTPDMSIVDMERANNLIAQCGSPHYALHMGIQNKGMRPGMSDEDIHRRMVENVNWFKKSISVPLLIENPPDSPTDRTVYDLYPFHDADKVTRLVRETGICFLLDIAHAGVTAKFRGWDLYDYLSALPLDVVREIHVVGTGVDEEGYPKDTHSHLEDADYKLLEWVLAKTNPDVVTLEYGGYKVIDKEALKRQLAILAEMIKSKDK